MIISEKIIEAFLETIREDLKFRIEKEGVDKWILHFSTSEWKEDIPVTVRIVRNEEGTPVMLLIYHSVEINIDDLGKEDLLTLLALNREINFAKVALLKEEGIIGVTLEMPTMDISVEEIFTGLVSVVQGTTVLHTFIDSISHRVGFRIPKKK